MTTFNKVAAGAASAVVLALATPVLYKWEGEIRHGYKDPIGIVTSCVGHTRTAELGRAYTAEECLEQLRVDLEDHDAGLRACVKTELPPNVHAAMLSFTFNVGVAKACGSTAFKYLNAGRFVEACRELPKWVRANGVVLKGLVKRRADEMALCLGERRLASLGVTG